MKDELLSRLPQMDAYGLPSFWTRYAITPVPKPRMTHRDKWKGRPSVVRYFAYRDAVRGSDIMKTLVYPDQYFHVLFYLPIPKSWTRTEKETLRGAPHLKRPDLDNLVKGFLDAVFMEEDCSAWDYRASKLWGDEGRGAIYLSLNMP